MCLKCLPQLDSELRANDELSEEFPSVWGYRLYWPQDGAEMGNPTHGGSASSYL